MPTEKKRQTVEDLRDKLARCTIAVATDLTGLPASAVTDLRQKMRERDVEYRVVKNTLAHLAADAAGRPHIKGIVSGPTALALGYKDPVEVAKALEEYIRVNRSILAVKGGVLDGRTLSSQEVFSLAQLPPRAELVARLAGQLQAPIARLLLQLQSPVSRLLTVLNGPTASLTYLLQRRLEQLQSQQKTG